MVLTERLLLVAILVFGIASTATLYSLNGRIEALEGRLAMPEVASAITGQQGKAAVEQLAALTPAPAGGPQLAIAPQPQPAVAPPSRPPLASVDEMVGRLEARLGTNPNDAEGWRMLGWSYFETGRYDEAARAYAKAIKANPDIAAYRSARGEALVKAAGNVVTGEAGQLFAEAVRLDPKDLKARFFEGFVKAQAGDKTAALDAWISLANEVDLESPLAPELTQRIAALSRDIGVDVSSRLRQAPPAAVVAAPLSPSQDQSAPGEAKGVTTDEGRAAPPKE